MVNSPKYKGLWWLPDDEGNQIGTKDPETKKKRIKMSMNVKMEGAKTDFPEITSDKEAE